MKKINNITLKIEIDDSPDVSYLGEIADSQTTRKQYNKHWIPVDPENPDGEWFSQCNHLMEGIILRASIAVSDDGTHWAHDEIVYSLWGIESDGGEDYKATIVKDLSAELEHELTLWGFSHDEILNALMEMTTA